MNDGQPGALVCFQAGSSSAAVGLIVGELPPGMVIVEICTSGTTSTIERATVILDQPDYTLFADYGNDKLQ